MANRCSTSIRPATAIIPNSNHVVRFSSTDPTIEVMNHTTSTVPNAILSSPLIRATVTPTHTRIAENIAAPASPPVTSTAITVLCAVSPGASPAAVVKLPAP